ncbi:thioesterase domain-containing protein, partial [Granulicella sp. L60]|uniref:thioesterase domain-containing protein n=1 Tax=Granulicella sp. L60 TaxID=1641866 RepID=UPI0020B13399
SLADGIGAEQLRLHLFSSLPEHMVPAAYVRLESFPLTLSGKLDRRALPAPEQDAYATRGYEPPRGEIEEKLAAVWAEVLKLDRVGRHDNFFELGGHSLLATQLINKIQTTFKVELSLRTLLETATVARLAEQIDNSIGVRQIEVLLPIRTKGTLKPIFFVHPGGGLSQCYIGFLKHLDRERPIYGLQSRNFTASSLSVQTIEEMAVDYYDEIRKVQPTGPYHLAGWSIGGQIAFAIANVIQRLGDDVALLSVFDSIPFPSREAENTDPYASQTLLDFAYDFFGQDLRSQCPTLQALCDRLRQDNRLPHSINENHFPVLLQNIRDASTQGQTFVPMKYPGDLLIFIATEKKEIDVSYFLKEWQPYVGGAIRYHLIACSHGEMMNPIPLAEIASLLEIELKNLRAECGEYDPVP